MQKDMLIPSLEMAKSYIYSINFSSIIDKLVNYNGWIRKEAEITCELYRNFLYLNKKYGHEYRHLPPSEDIDEFWHNHILDTQKYEIDCYCIFGKFFHHYPYLGIDSQSNFEDLNRAFETTQELYFKEFGSYISPTYSARSMLSSPVTNIFAKFLF